MAETEAEKTPLEQLEEYANGASVLSLQEVAGLLVEAVKGFTPTPPVRRTESTAESSSESPSSSTTRPARSL